MNREERLVRNEVLARQINEGVEEAHRERGSEDTVRMLCECGNSSCERVIPITLAEYERVRRDPLLFAIVGDHILPDVEDLAEDHGRYVVVRKKEGEAAEIARQEDPRSNPD